MQVHETVSDRYCFNLNAAGTMLKVECLEKCLSLGLSKSRSRSLLVAKIRRLGLMELQEGLGLGLGPKTECLGLVS